MRLKANFKFIFDFSANFQGETQQRFS